MWSSCGFNMALFRNTSVLWYPRSWTVTGSFFFLLHCLLDKKELCRFPGRVSTATLTWLNHSFSTITPMLIWPPGGNWGKFSTPVNGLWYARESLDSLSTMKLYTLENEFYLLVISCAEKRWNCKICIGRTALLPSDWREIWSFRKKLAFSSEEKSIWSKRGYFKCII